ncbi:MAG: hypothetical protein WC314_00510 [Vulcanimicrobiota bacterium]
MKRITFLILLVGLTMAPAPAQTPTVEQLLKIHQRASAELEDVQAKASLSLKLLVGILPYSENLAGRYYYLKPDQHKLEFDDAPSYFDQAPSLFKWDLPDPKRYRVKVKGPFREASGEIYQLLYLSKKADSSTQSVLCTFDASTGRLFRQETSYRDGGSVALAFNYLATSDLPVLDKVKAQVKIPSYSLSGTASIAFSEQKYNKGLDKSIFPEG